MKEENPVLILKVLKNIKKPFHKKLLIIDKFHESEKKKAFDSKHNDFDKIKISDDKFKSKIKEPPRIISSTSILAASKENQITTNVSKSSLPNPKNNFFYLKNGLKRQHSNNPAAKFSDSLNHTLISAKEQGKYSKKSSQKSFHFDSRRDLNSFFRKDSNYLDTSQNLNQSIYSTSQNPMNKSLNRSIHSKQKFILPTSPVIQTERNLESISKNFEGRISRHEVSVFEPKLESGNKELKNNSFSKFLEENHFKKPNRNQFQKKLFQGKEKANVNIKTISLIQKVDEFGAEMNEKTKKLSSNDKNHVKTSNIPENLQQKSAFMKEKRWKNERTKKKKFKLFDERKKFLKEKKGLIKELTEYNEENKELEETNASQLQAFDLELKKFNAIKKENLILKSLYEVNKIFNVKFDLSSFECFRSYPEIVISKSDFQVLHDKFLGRGGFAEVFSGIYQKRAIAIKIITISNDLIKHLLNEIMTMMICNHENLVKLFAISIEETKPNEISVYLLMELMRKDLKQIVFAEKKKLSKIAKYDILCDILKGLVYLHDSNYVHCDLKMQNILLDENNFAKISDFGLAKTLRSGNTKKSLIYGYSERCSSYEYLVEERISTKGDIWSFGILAYELLKEKISWDKLTGVQAVAKVSMKTPFFSMNDKLDDSFENNFIESCLNYNYAQRPSAKELLDKINNKKKTLF